MTTTTEQDGNPTEAAEPTGATEPTEGAHSTLDSRAEVLEGVAAALGVSLLSSRRLHAEANGEGIVSGHEVVIEGLDGTSRTETIYLDDDPAGHDRDGVLCLREELTGEHIHAWLYPADPELPVLAAAVFPAAAGVLLTRLRLDPADLALEVVAYRARKRAVVRMTTRDRTLFLKVVKPASASVLASRHETWSTAGIPVPRVLAWSPDGLVALEQLPGIEAVTALAAIDRPRLLDSLDDLVDRISRVPSDGRARASLVSRLDWYERRAAHQAPEYGARIRHTVAQIAERRDRGGAPRREVTIHGDLHLSQVFVERSDPSVVTGVLDIDTAGLGDPADDAAALLAHLLATAEHRTDARDTAGATQALELSELYRMRWRDHSDPGFDDRATAITATHLLGHALSGAIRITRALDLASGLLAVDPPAKT